MEGFHRALAVDPTAKGFGWVVLEGSERLVDWGRTDVPGGARDDIVESVVERADFFEVTLAVVEDISDTYRGARACQVIKAIHHELAHRGLDVDVVSRSQVRKMFRDSGTSKQEIAEAIGRWFPEMAPWVPPRRERWMDEDPRMTLFDAASFGLTALRHREWGTRNEDIWL